ncbi:tetraacyldisaccharide 4'-kinase [Flavobacteriaceae bacterium UJ101]|nr:tetraacyldisaccharide 4'-kinase [Flavobacteriaceae bacterium UJ101]
MYFRNLLYDKGIFKSTSFGIPIICIGNLSVGGTGKTPHTEYLVRLLKRNYHIAILSRGYGRKSKGYILSNEEATAETLGDEPLQFYSKFGEEIIVAVDENRVEGVQNLIRDVNPEIVLLDDAFQHRAIKAGFYILLTPYEDLFTDDYILPAGNLRESRKGVERANIVVVTKCPNELNLKNKNIIISNINSLSKVKVYFSSVEYDNKIYGVDELDLESIYGQKIVMVTGIANPKPMVEYLKDKVQIEEHLAFSDHYNFTEKEVSLIKEKAKDKLILTTEKDYMRLQQFEFLRENLYYLPIQIRMDKPNEFNQEIQQFINRF